MVRTSIKATRDRGKQPGNRWPLQEAKTRLSELVREAQANGPQHVTLHGRDAVVVVDATEFARLQRRMTGRDLVEALQSSPLGDVEFERLSVKSPVRDVQF